MKNVDDLLYRFLGGFSESEYLRFLDEHIPQSVSDNVEQWIPELEFQLWHFKLPGLSDYWHPLKDRSFPSTGHARRICSELHDYVCSTPGQKELEDAAFVYIYFASLYLFCDSHSSTAVNPIPERGMCLIIKACRVAGLEAVLHCLKYIRWLNERFKTDLDFDLEGMANCELGTVSLLALLFNEMAGATWDSIDQFLEHEASSGFGMTGPKGKLEDKEWVQCLDEIFGKKGSVAEAVNLVRTATARKAAE